MILEGLRIALRSIVAHKMRSFLAVLGNIVAITALVVIVSIIQGLDAKMEEMLLSRGADVFSVDSFGVVFSEEEWEAIRHRDPISMADARSVSEGTETVGHVLISDRQSATVKCRDRELEAITVEGRSEDYPWFEETELDRGRHFSPQEASRRRPVAVLGWDVAERLFEGRNALDQKILVGGHHYQVVGVMKKRGALLGMSRDRYVILPIQTLEKQWGRLRSVDLRVKPRVPELFDACVSEVRGRLRAVRGLRPKQRDDFEITASATYLKMYRDTTRALSAALVGLVALALVVGGIVIANIMLMVVAERTREIGIRKAVGARRSALLWQFLAEAAGLSVVGGLAGLGLGAGIAAIITAVSPLACAIQPWSVAAGLGLVMAVGVGAGLYPAARAAMMDPIVALRDEK